MSTGKNSDLHITDPVLQPVRLPRHNLRSAASTLKSLHRLPHPPPLPTHLLTVVCISDTHYTRPPIPPSDLLLHAGDLSQWGTFSEIQAQLTWLSDQPHQCKVVRWKQARQAARADNHMSHGDNPAANLNWGDVIYIQNSSVTLSFHCGRSLNIYGSPLTPQYGLSAFQHPPSEDVWTEKTSPHTDIILTHGPPRGHLDGFKKSGCAFLAREVMRVQPRLVVYRHIHEGHGTEEIVYDRVGKAYEEIFGQPGRWDSLLGMAWGVLLGYLVPKSWRHLLRKITFVNAAVVEGCENYVVKNEAVVVQI
ncbi:hypothetical protein BDR22DRAFT_878873 [Usnea florida]